VTVLEPSSEPTVPSHAVWVSAVAKTSKLSTKKFASSAVSGLPKPALGPTMTSPVPPSPRPARPP